MSLDVNIKKLCDSEGRYYLVDKVEKKTGWKNRKVRYNRTCNKGHVLQNITTEDEECKDGTKISKNR